MTRNHVHLLVLLSGMAALSWEVIWQLKSSLALGVSAWGTALTLAVTMGGMGIGSLLSGYFVRWNRVEHPIRVYGLIEMMIGLCGLFLGSAFRAVERIDTLVYMQTGAASPLVYLAGIVASIGLPAMCMGATVPVLGLVARHFGTSISVLYGLNTLGAAAGVIIAAFVLIPLLGVSNTGLAIAAVNFGVGLYSWFAGGKARACADEKGLTEKTWVQFDVVTAGIIVFVTGFATFVLEVAWFRSLKASFLSTTSAFAIMLSTVLLALGLAGWLVPYFKERRLHPGWLICLSGTLILLATPLIERFHLVSMIEIIGPLPLSWFVMTFYVIGPPVLFLGVALPWIIGDSDTPRRWAMLYFLNTFTAIAGALCAAWFLLPSIGVARTAWLAGGMVLVAGLLAAPRGKVLRWGAMGIAAFAVAVFFESGLGRTAVQWHYHAYGLFKKILEYREGPDVTVAAIEYNSGSRVLLVDGFLTASQFGEDGEGAERYMEWMGHLPMLLHPDPENALVICFGTGQTSNAVRKENPKTLDIVDINKNVYLLARHFDRNEGVLDDPRVNPVVMDGRAYMRRTDKTYDVITLEPMPPTFAGVNALYSKEFYETARERLSDDGVIAQWVPFHLAEPRYMASIARTFQEVFPNAVMWMDPYVTTGILLGTKDDKAVLGAFWPGFDRVDIPREHPREVVEKSLYLDRESLKRYGFNGDVITDDNQLLAYGGVLDSGSLDNIDETILLLERAKNAGLR